jgi:predicted transcriptional regulator
MALRDQALSRGASILIFDPHDLIESGDYNTRDMQAPSTIEYIRGMADAIIANGNEAFPPITITQEGDKIAVMAGWCRRRAHVLAMDEGALIKGIACLAAGKKRPEEITLDILTSNSGLPLSAMERAKAVKRLLAFLWSPEDIAKKTGWSVSTVRNLITLHDSPDAIIDMVNSGQVSATLATKLVKEKGADKAVAELESAIETSAKAGKKKATQGDLERVKTKAVKWAVEGPKCYKLLNAIYELPISRRKNELDDLIASTGELLGEIEEQMGKVDF